jgi:hypothetical protein
MRRMITLATLSLTLMGGVAMAGPHEVVHETVHVRGPAVHENVVVHEGGHGPVVRENVVVHGPAVHANVVVHGPGVRENVVVHEGVHENVVVHEGLGGGVRENVILREPVREGVVVRGGPVWHEGVHFRDVNIRPEYRYESWHPIAGYNWHRGDWVFNGVEWIWTPGWYVRVEI